MSKNNSNTDQAKQSCKTGVSGSVFHHAISHINCDENISKETVNAINEMVDCVISENRSITFNKEAQDALPQHIKDKMKLQREESRTLKNKQL